MNEHKKYYIFYFILFFTWSSVYTLVTIYLKETAQFELAEIGVFMSFLPILSLIFQPIWGAISDSTMYKKRLLQGIMSANALLAIVMVLFTEKPVVVVVYCFYSIFMCAQGPMTDSMAINHVTRTAQGSYGGIRMWGSVGYAVGAYAVAQIVSYIGLKSIFIIAAVGFVFSVLLLNNIKEYSVAVERNNYLKDLKGLLRQREYVFVLIYSFMFLGAFFGSDQYIGLYFRFHGIEVSRIGLLTFIAVCIEVPLIFYSKRLIEYFGVIPMMVVMTSISALRMFLLSVSTVFAAFVVTSILRGVSVGIFIPLFIELISKITPKALTTSAISIYSAVGSGVAVFFFTFMGGLLADHFGYSVLYGTYGLLTLVPLLLIFNLKKTTPKF